MNELEKIKNMREALESRRKEKYNNIPANLVDKILESLAKYGDNAYREIDSILSNYFKETDNV